MDFNISLFLQVLVLLRDIQFLFWILVFQMACRYPLRRIFCLQSDLLFLNNYYLHDFDMISRNQMCFQQVHRLDLYWLDFRG